MFCKKRVLHALTVAFVSFSLILVSCDKCKDTNCSNGGTCNEGICECTFQYEGNDCSEEIRNKYEGQYKGVAEYGDGSTEVYTLTVAPIGPDAKRFLLDDEFPATLSSKSAFNVSYVESANDELETVYGTGSFTSTTISFELTYTYSYRGQVIETETIKFEGSKL